MEVELSCSMWDEGAVIVDDCARTREWTWAGARVAAVLVATSG